ncbi:ATP-binding protein [Rummeliibacillus sp. TYF-LIM-RU47]|uniref:ATP-binding protein n=1 Tax=Rummeliibacillus sp. TYF-LIM-RU47 TaxID=2608406 RepID=UPI0012392606|nr:AAA family ATPase [Rummeliibacillus sp. TYF-LIM-RU47]
MEVISGKIEKAKKVVLYGPEGIGKSSLAAQFPNPIFIDTEGSTTELTVDRLKKPSSWTELNQQVDWVKGQAGKYLTLVIDTVDWAERLAIEFITSRSNKTSITNFGYGEGFIQLEEEFGKFLNKLSDLVEVGINVVLSAHAKITKFEQPDEMGAYDRYELKLGNKTTAKTAALTKEWADMVLFLNYKTFSVAADEKGKKHKGQGGVRTIYATHHPAWDAKNRHGLPDEFPLDYSYIAHIFNGLAQSQPVQQQQTVQEPVQAQIQQEPVQQPAPMPIPEQPAQPTEQQPMQPSTPVQSSPIVPELNPNIPQALRDLMTQNHVSEDEIQTVVSNKGYYPMGTPILNYDPGFINGVLVGAWQQVYGMILEIREQNVPF